MVGIKWLRESVFQKKFFDLKAQHDVLLIQGIEYLNFQCYNFSEFICDLEDEEEKNPLAL